MKEETVCNPTCFPSQIGSGDNFLAFDKQHEDILKTKLPNSQLLDQNLL